MNDIEIVQLAYSCINRSAGILKRQGLPAPYFPEQHFVRTLEEIALYFQAPQSVYLLNEGEQKILNDILHFTAHTTFKPHQLHKFVREAIYACPPTYRGGFFNPLNKGHRPLPATLLVIVMHKAFSPENMLDIIVSKHELRNQCLMENAQSLEIHRAKLSNLQNNPPREISSDFFAAVSALQSISNSLPQANHSSSNEAAEKSTLPCVIL